MGFFTDLLNHSPYAGFFILLVLGGIGFPIPEDFILILCGSFIATQVVEPVPALLIVWVGMLITDLGLYYVGRKYGAKIVSHRRFQRVISPERLKVVEEKVERWGMLFILVGRHLVVLRAQVFLASGVLKMPFVKFVVADGIAAIITMGVMVGAGYAGGYYLSRVEHDVKIIKYVGAVVAGLLIVGLLTFFWLRSRRKRGAEGRPKPPAAERT
jgi:membrane protein DedA with SNARE-associated domain